MSKEDFKFSFKYDIHLLTSPKIGKTKKLEKFEEFPKKPTERCKIGRETTFRTNHFLIEFSKPEFDFDNLVTQYDVTITENIYDTKSKNPTVKVVESASIGL